MKNLKKVLAVAASSVALAGTALTSPAHAAYPVTHFHLEYGASILDGDLTWYNQSVGVSGTNKVASGSGCRYAAFEAANYAGARDYLTSSPLCVATTRPFEGTLSINVAGGADYVVVSYHARSPEDGAYYRVASQVCYRTGCHAPIS
ncbi:hypothetical protein ACFPM3_22910 [Streptomyces coeruleoprunus]|uniref:Secreted protein n=1 Tax=Streptomyces coeruleoprunus TaxID=285563 RepID=A0ABV9XHW3_9ACTN